MCTNQSDELSRDDNSFTEVQIIQCTSIFQYEVAHQKSRKLVVIDRKLDGSHFIILYSYSDKYYSTLIANMGVQFSSL